MNSFCKRWHNQQISANVVLLFLLMFLFLNISSTAIAQNSGKKVVLVSIDGMPDYILDKLLAEGKMPNLKRLVENGVSADYMVTSFPAVTAVAHPVIWTGAEPWENAITGNVGIGLPHKENNILTREKGMKAYRLRAEPIWSAVARQGKKAFVLQATQTYPQENIYYGDKARFKAIDENLTVLDGYAKRLVPYRIFNQNNVTLSKTREWKNLPESKREHIWFSARTAGETHFFLIFDSPAVAVEGYDSLWVCAAKDGSLRLTDVKLAAPSTDKDNFSEAVFISEGEYKAYIYYRLFELDPELKIFSLLRTPGNDLLALKKDIAEQVLHKAGGFIGNGARKLYNVGLLGAKALDGGDGNAEIIYLETIKKMFSLSEKAVAWSLKNYQWDFFVAYTPVPDEVHHNWLGALNPVGDMAEGQVCEALKQPMDEVYQMVDDFIGVIIENMPDDCLFAVVSDHGHATVTQTFLPNILLRKAGLLQLDKNGKIDLGKTRAMYYVGNSYYVVINSVRFKDGIVQPDEIKAVRMAVKQALDAALDEKGQKLVTGYLEPGAGEGIPEHFGGDLYLKLKPGVICHPGYRGESFLTDLPTPISEHYGDPEYRYMNSIFVIGKKYGKVGREYEFVRAKDIAPTLCSILGIDSPLQASGVVLGKLVEVFQESN